MRIQPSARSLEQALVAINNRGTRDFSVSGNNSANQLFSITERDLKVKLYDNRHGLTDFKYNIKEFQNANMNFTQRL